MRVGRTKGNAHLRQEGKLGVRSAMSVGEKGIRHLLAHHVERPLSALGKCVDGAEDWGTMPQRVPRPTTGAEFGLLNGSLHRLVPGLALLAV